MGQLEGQSLVVLDGREVLVDAFVHLIRILHGVALVTVEHHGRDGGPSLRRQLLQLLAPSWVVDHGDLPRIADVKLAIVDEALDLYSDLLGVADVLLEVLLLLFEPLDLGVLPVKLLLDTVLQPLDLLHLLFGPSPLGGDLHQVRRVALGHYENDIQKRLEKDDKEYQAMYV